MAATEHIARTGVYQLVVVIKDGPVAWMLSVVRIKFKRRTNNEFIVGSVVADNDLCMTGVGIEWRLGMIGIGFISKPVADAGHLAAAEHSTIDARATLDLDLGVGHTTCTYVLIILHIALACTKDVANGLFAILQQF